MANCYVCNARNANQSVLEENDINAERKREISILHRIRFGLEQAEVTRQSKTCINCRRRINKVIQMEADPNAIPMEVVVQRKGKCFICVRNCQFLLGLEARVDFYVKTEKFLLNYTRCCNGHLNDDGTIKLEFIEHNVSIPLGIIMNGLEVKQWFSKIREYISAAAEKRFESEINFEDDDFKSLTSLSKEQFLELYGYCGPVFMCNNYRHVTKKQLIAFLIKLRQGLSDRFLKSFMHYSSRQNVSLAISLVRESLMVRFVRDNLGFNSMEVRDRNNFIQTHVTEFSNILYNPEPNIRRAILYPDCTYIRAPKSSHFRVQRQSYSSHKKYTLLKAGLIVAPDGYIVDIHGPYFSDSRNNDASILIREMRDEQQEIRNWIQDYDIFVVDRGYRDAVEFLNNLNLNCEIPPFLPRGQRQLTTEDANTARTITKTRWIVESRNGHLKSVFKFFRDMVPMQHCINLNSTNRLCFDK